MPNRVLVIDNYDSFVYILVQYLAALGADVLVRRNDEVSLSEAVSLKPDALLISPGPGHPQDSGICCELILEVAGKIPVLGVCLGHQCIGHAYGGKIVRAPKVMHGKVSEIYHENSGVLRGIPTPLWATRYHSLVIEPCSFSEELEVTASTADGVIMGVRHRSLPVEGLQFHPESQKTVAGRDILKNFLSQVEGS